MKRLIEAYVLIFCLWALYRIFFRLPEGADELLTKPVVFVILPVVFLQLGRIPGFERRKHVFEDILIGIVCGMVFGLIAVVTHYVKYGGFFFEPVVGLVGGGLLLYLGLSLATSFSEEVLGRGVLFGQLKNEYSLFVAAFYSSILMLLLYVPIFINSFHAFDGTALVFLGSVLMLSMVNCYLYKLRGNIILPILVHALWNMTVALYI